MFHMYQDHLHYSTTTWVFPLHFAAFPGAVPPVSGAAGTTGPRCRPASTFTTSKPLHKGLCLLPLVSAHALPLGSPPPVFPSASSRCYVLPRPPLALRVLPRSHPTPPISSRCHALPRPPFAHLTPPLAADWSASAWCSDCPGARPPLHCLFSPWGKHKTQFFVVH